MIPHRQAGVNTTASGSWVDKDEGDGWGALRPLNASAPNQTTEMVFAQSVTSLSRASYFSIQTLFTVGFGDNSPIDATNMVLSILPQFIGVFVVAFTIANITSLLVNLDSTAKQHKQDMSLVDSVLADQGIDHALKVRVDKYFNYLYNKQAGVSLKAMVNRLPLSMQRRIAGRDEEKWQQLELFKDITTQQMVALIQSTKPFVFTTGDTVFRKSEQNLRLHLINSGSLAAVSNKNKSYFHHWGPGECYGLDFILDDKYETNYNVLATCFTETLSVTRAAAMKILKMGEAGVSSRVANNGDEVKESKESPATTASDFSRRKAHCQTMCTVRASEFARLSNDGSGAVVKSGRRRPSVDASTRDTIDGKMMTMADMAAMATKDTKRDVDSAGVFMLIWECIMLLVAVYYLLCMPARAVFYDDIWLNQAGFVLTDFFCDILLGVDAALRIRRGRAYFMFGRKEKSVDPINGQKDGTAKRAPSMEQKRQVAQKERDAKTMKVVVGSAITVYAILSIVALLVGKPFGILDCVEADPIKRMSCSGSKFWPMWRLPFLLYALPFCIQKTRSIESAMGARGKQLSTDMSLAIKLAIVLLVCLHWFSCTSVLMIKDAVAKNDGHLYLQGLYFTLTTMTTTGFGDILPFDTGGAWYSVALMLVGVTMYSGAISFVTILMHEVDISEYSIDHQMATMQKYMASREIEESLQQRVVAYLKHVGSNKLTDSRRVLGFDNGSAKRSVQPVQFLPKHLRDEVVLSMCRNVITSCPIFKEVSKDKTFVDHVVKELTWVNYCPEDIVWDSSEGTRKLYFMHSGTAGLFEKNIKISELRVGDCFGVISFFMPDLEKRMLKSMDFCEFWVLSWMAMDNLRSLHPDAYQSVIAQGEATTTKIQAAKNKGKDSKNKTKQSKMDKMMSMDDGGGAPASTARKVIAPFSPIQYVLNLVMFLILTYYIISTPLRLAYSGGEFIDSSIVLDYVFDLITVAEIVCRARYLADNIGEVRTPTEIWRRYRKWIGLDILSVIPFEIILYAWKLGGGEQVTWQLFAAFRLTRVIKSYRLNWYMSSFETLLPPTSNGTTRVAKLVLMLLLLSHWVACLFFGVAMLNVPAFPAVLSNATTNLTNVVTTSVTTNLTTGRGLFPGGSMEHTWINDTRQGTGGLYAKDSGTQYIYSVYWSLSTITAVGYGDIFPVSDLEQAFVVLVLVLGGLVMSLVIANLETVVAQADATSVLFQSRTDYIKKYLEWRQVPSGTRVQVTNYLLHTWLEQKGVDEDSLLSYVCPSLRDELVSAQLRGQIAHCSVLKPFKNKVVTKLQARNYMQGNVIVHIGELSNTLFVLVKGVVEIMSDELVTLQKLTDEGMFSEGSFFGAKAHEANAVCTTNCNLFCLHMHDLKDVVAETSGGLKAYAGVKDEFMAKKGGGTADLQKNLKNKKMQSLMMDEVVEVKKVRVAMPNSNVMRIWDGLLVFMILWNAMTIPFKIGFIHSSTRYVSTATGLFVPDIIFDIFCIVTIVLRSRFFARYKGGVLQKLPADVTKAYIKSVGGLWFDLLCFLPVDLVYYAATGDYMVASLLRIPRMLYLIRLPSLFQSVEDALDERMYYIQGGYRHVIKLLVYIMLACNWCACARGIIEWAEQGDVELYATLGDGYGRAIYWAVYTITTVGYGNVVPESSAQRILAGAACVLGALLCDAGITSTLCSIVDSQDAEGAVLRRYKESLQVYMNENDQTTFEERTLVKEFDHYLETEMEDLDEIKAINMLAPSYRAEVLGFNAFQNVGNLRAVPALISFNTGMIRSLCEELRPVIFVEGDVLLRKGTKFDLLIFVVRGKVEGTTDENAEENEAKAPASPRGTPQPNTVTKGLVGATLSWQQPMPLSYRAAKTTQTLVVTEIVYDRVWKVKPRIGGLYNELSDIIGDNFREADKVAEPHFRKFISKQHCCENLDFYLSVTQLCSKKEFSAEAKKKSDQILNKFVSADAATQINIPDVLRKKIEGHVRVLQEVLGCGCWMCVCRGFGLTWCCDGCAASHAASAALCGRMLLFFCCNSTFL